MNIPKSCREEEGGKPKCNLGCSTMNTTVEVRGTSLGAINNYHNRNSLNLPVKDHYDVMFVHSTPDKVDDQNRLPLSGPIGKDLIDLCIKAGFDVDSCYVTYIVKCHPNYTQPSVQETKACLEHLEYEIKKYNPKLIILLGNLALRAFNLKGGITSLRGNFFDLPLPSDKTGNKYKIFPTFDPVRFFIRHDPRGKRRMFDDLIRAANYVKKGVASDNNLKVDVKVIKTIDQLDLLVERINETEFFAFDTESEGFPWYNKFLTTFSLAWNENQKIQSAVVPIYKRRLEPAWKNFNSVFDRLRPIFENEKISKAAHNTKYDALVLRYWANIELKGTLYDSMLMHHLLTEIPPHDLEYLADIEFATGNYSENLHRIVGSGKVLRKPYSEVPDHILWPYATRDAISAYKLAILYSSQLFLKPHLYSLYFKQIVPINRILMEAEFRGVKLDKKIISKLFEYYTNRQEELLIKLKRDTKPDFNPLSYDNVAQVIIEKGYGEEIKDKNKTKGYNLSKDRLFSLNDKLPFCKDILEYRTNRKMLSTYIDDAVANMDDKGRVHYSFLIHGTETGRLSCRWYHQIPKVDSNLPVNLRDSIVSDEDHDIVYGDFSQVEFAIFAILVYVYTGDDKLLKDYESGIDMHKKTASIGLDIDIDKVSTINRQLGKTINFGILFGSKGQELIKLTYEDKNGKQQKMTWDKVNNCILNFQREYPGVKDYANIVVDLARKNDNTHVSVFGRERHMGNKLSHPDPYIRRSAERELVNSTIQGVAGDLTTKTIIEVHKVLQEKNLVKKVHFLKSIHDSTTYESEQMVSKMFAYEILKPIAERPIPQLENRSFKFNIGIGKSWAQAEENAK